MATPIGNLGDLSPRAIETLATADVIACEDTRRTRKLLSHAGVKAKVLMAVHDFNEASQVRAVLDHLDQGRHVALVVDAGTPGISDPGQRVVTAAGDAGHQVVVVPGPSAAIAALVASGFSSERFVFEGFLPRKGRDRAERLALIAGERRTTVIYEAPNRLRRTVEDLLEACGPARRVAVARELTKLHEDVWRGSLAAAAERVATTEARGEHVVVLDAAPAPVGAGDSEVERALLARYDAGDDRRAALTAVATELRVPKRRVYQVALRLRDRDVGAAGDLAEPD
ncbi:MAG TPA: 16S rRNA (cytidine(1402)-2'-O)-methyltransferase [Acidimicrobiales bacterium]|nr:16S rRNA (cytidine(1402)-2'-O)-methyltransferase [Acidimicrobiales bacterium]